MLKIGQTVYLKPSHAKWHLNNQDIYIKPSTGKFEPCSEIENYMHIMCCFGVPVKGKIIRPGIEKCWGVEWTVPGTKKKVFYFVGRSHITLEPQHV